MGCIHVNPLTFRGLSPQTLPLCSVQLHVSWNPEASPGLCIFSYRIKYTQVLSADGTVPFQAPKEATCLIPKSCQQPATSRCLIIEDSSNKKALQFTGECLLFDFREGVEGTQPQWRPSVCLPTAAGFQCCQMLLHTFNRWSLGNDHCIS